MVRSSPASRRIPPRRSPIHYPEAPVYTQDARTTCAPGQFGVDGQFAVEFAASVDAPAAPVSQRSRRDGPKLPAEHVVGGDMDEAAALPFGHMSGPGFPGRRR